jgi:predicted N-acetyltransferase YhbS
VTVRPYDHQADYELVGDFLVDIHRPGRGLPSWLQPRWEYMHYHSLSDGLPFERFGVAERDGLMVGLIHFEHNPAFNYLQVRPGCEGVIEDLLDWAEAHLGGRSITFGHPVIGLFVDDTDWALEEAMNQRGFELHAEHSEEHARFVVDGPIDSAPLPEGFGLLSLDDDNDFEKINRVLWRGFNHEGPPPEEEIPARKRAQMAPNFRKDLTVIAVAPNGDYASFAGMWQVADRPVAYVEPVATDPTYRRMGLGRAAVLESIRRVAAAGAREVWVGSDQEFYLAMGFEIETRTRLWVKTLD